jgi:hypothetical protein
MKLRVLLSAAVLACGMVAGTAGVASAAPIHQSRLWYTCHGGSYTLGPNGPVGDIVAVPSGHYGTLVIRGACNVTPGTVIKAGSIIVAANALFDAQSAPSTITAGDVTAGPNSILGLGCLPGPNPNLGHACASPNASKSSDITVRNITGIDVNTVLLNGITVKGNLTLIKGGDQAGSPWPIKLDTIKGNVTIVGATPEWIGLVYDTIGANVVLLHDTIATGENIDVANNTIRANLICYALAPDVSGGPIPGEHNTVGGASLGQCAHLQNI